MTRQVRSRSDTRTTGTRPRSGARRLLIVEDDAQIAGLLTFIFEEAGYRTKIVTTGTAALDAVSRFQPDVVTLDLGLPELDGQSVLESLWAHAETRAVPVVVVSAWTEDLRRTPQVRAVVHKPFDVGWLLQVVATASDESFQARQAIGS